MVEISKSQIIFPFIIMMIDFQIGLLCIIIDFNLYQSTELSSILPFNKTLNTLETINSIMMVVIPLIIFGLNVYSYTKVVDTEAKALKYTHFVFPKCIVNALLFLQTIYSLVIFFLMGSHEIEKEQYLYRRVYLLAIIIFQFVQIIFDFLVPLLYVKLRNIELPKAGLLL